MESEYATADRPGLIPIDKRTHNSAIYWLLVLCLGFLPLTALAKADAPHHALGDCVDGSPGAPHAPVDCEIDTCPGVTTSCGSQYGVAMISVALPGLDDLPRNLARVDRGRDRLHPPPPSRIDRPPIA